MEVLAQRGLERVDLRRLRFGEITRERVAFDKPRQLHRAALRFVELRFRHVRAQRAVQFIDRLA